MEGSSEQRALATAFNDMTERVERLVRSHRDFVADASHQLRTPLAGLRLRLEEAEAVGSSPAAEEEIRKALGEVDRLSEVVDELLVLSRAGERDGRGERVELADAATRSADRWSAAAREHGVELSARGNGAGAVLCAPSDLDRALDALVENAINYSGSGGLVEIVAGANGIEVLDRGPGLAAGEEEEVFERFHRGSAGRQAGRGTGLGLPIASELARAWGGEVTLSNRPGGGTRAALALRSKVDAV